MPEEKIIYIRETTLGSITSDIANFGVIVVSFWFNQQYINGNDWLDALLFIIFFVNVFSKLGNLKRLSEPKSLVTPTTAQDAVTKTYVDKQL